MFLVNEFKFNTNTYTSKIARNSKCIYARAHGNHQEGEGAPEQGLEPLRAPIFLELLEPRLESPRASIRSGCRKKGCNKRGCLQTQTKAHKCRQTQANADFKLSEKGPKTQIIARKRKQTQTNANKRKIEELHPLLRTPFCGSPLDW